MDLEEWVKDDMTHFIKKHEVKKKESKVPIRMEDAAAQFQNVDYEKRIRTALRENRYSHARELFNELKTKFSSIPLDHQQERKQYFRIMQKSYKMIYDYVADKHKLSRIVSSMSQNTDVFDSRVPSTDLSRAPDEGAPLPTVEEAMKGSAMQPIIIQQAAPRVVQQAPPALPALSTDHTVETALAAQMAANDIGQATQSMKKAAENLMEASKKAMEKEASATIKQAAKELVEATKEANKPKPPEPPKKPDHLPDWKPLEPHKLERKKRVAVKNNFKEKLPAFKVEKPPEVDTKPKWSMPESETLDKETKPDLPKPPKVKLPENPENTKVETAKNLLRQSRNDISKHDLKQAQKLVLQAKKEIEGITHSSLRKEIVALEKEIGEKLAADPGAAADSELFSSTYLRGIHAMAAGDYKTALHLFRSRVQQTPYDMAAKIRLAECMEVLSAKNN